MAVRIPEIHPITDLARDARGLVAGARERQEPVVITQRGREVAVLMPIELYRQLEAGRTYRMMSPRLKYPEDAARFTKTVTLIKEDPEE